MTEDFWGRVGEHISSPSFLADLIIDSAVVGLLVTLGGVTWAIRHENGREMARNTSDSESQWERAKGPLLGSLSAMQSMLFEMQSLNRVDIIRLLGRLAEERHEAARHLGGLNQLGENARESVTSAVICVMMLREPVSLPAWLDAQARIRKAVADVQEAPLP